MLDEEQAFLNAILAEPDDDTVRLVYADWLDEHGRAEMAEFIRVQCELEHLAQGAWSDAQHRLHSRMSELCRSLRAVYLEGYTPEERKRIDIQFERGFPEWLDVREGVPSDYRVLRHLRDVRCIRIVEGTISEEVLGDIASLKQLDVFNLYRVTFAPSWLEILDQLPPWTSVDIGDRDPALEPAWRALQARRAAALANVPTSRVRQTVRRRLDYDRDFSLDAERRPRAGEPIRNGMFHDAEDVEFALISRVSEFERLEFRDGVRTAESLRLLSRLPNLRALKLRDAHVGTITPVTECARLERLHVEMEDRTLTDNGTEGLERLTELRELHLNGGPGMLRDETIRRLAPLHKLRSLELHFGPLESDSLAVLSGLAALEKLTLVGPTSNADVRHMSGLVNLTFLSLRSSSVTDPGLEHLTRLVRLRTLEIRGGEPSVTETAARELAERLPEVTVILDGCVAKVPRVEMVFRRHLVNDRASILLPVHWMVDSKDQDHRGLRVEEDGWELIGRQSHEGYASIGLSCHEWPSSRTADQAVNWILESEHRERWELLERAVVSLPGSDTASCIRRDSETQDLVCEVVEPGFSVSIYCCVTPSRFEEFRPLFLFVARSLRVGEAAKEGVGEEVTVPVTEM